MHSEPHAGCCVDSCSWPALVPVLLSFLSCYVLVALFCFIFNCRPQRTDRGTFLFPPRLSMCLTHARIISPFCSFLLFYSSHYIYYRILAKNRYTYTFWAINRYTAHCTPEKASWRRLIFGLRSIVRANGSKSQGTPTTSYSTSVSPTFGFDCTYKWLERSLFRY